MTAVAKRLRPGVKRATGIRHSRYPDIQMLLAVANQPISVLPDDGCPLKTFIDFRYNAGKSHNDIDFPGIPLLEVHVALDSCLDVASYMWHAPEVICHKPDCTRLVRQPQILANLTSGTRVLIEILPEDQIDEEVIEASRILAMTLPYFGIRYMVVFPCQFTITPSWRRPS